MSLLLKGDPAADRKHIDYVYLVNRHGRLFAFDEGFIHSANEVNITNQVLSRFKKTMHPMRRLAI